MLQCTHADINCWASVIHKMFLFNEVAFLRVLLLYYISTLSEIQLAPLYKMRCSIERKLIKVDFQNTYILKALQ